jgi:hypothetical protein
VALEPKPAPAPAATSIPDDFGDFEDDGGAGGGDEQSDEDFARELAELEEAFGGGQEAEPEQKGEVPEDRAELYKLLGMD